jgi:hypothetical protein
MNALGYDVHKKEQKIKDSRPILNSAHFDGPRVPELGTTTSHGYLHLGVYQSGAVHSIIKTEEAPAEGITGL